MQRCNNIVGVLIIVSMVMACGPRAHIPARPAEPGVVPGKIAADDPQAMLVRALAPILFVQRDEWFPLERVVAVIHPEKRIIGYHLLWRDDVHGAWILSTVPTDQEIVWVGYDDSGAPTDLWTYWHGTILHADWRERGTVAVNVQWGKHGSLPRGIVESDLPRGATLNSFYLFTWLALPDIWLGRLTRRGPMCFCKGYDRYREFTRPIVLAERIDLIVRTLDPKPALATVFGRTFSKKVDWPVVGR